MAISEELGQQKEVQLPQGTIRYRERGTGEPIVFVHGALVNADLWRKVVRSWRRTSAASRPTCRSARTAGHERGRRPLPQRQREADRRLPRRARPRQRDARRQRHRRCAVPARRHAPARARRPARPHQLRRVRELPAAHLQPSCSTAQDPGFCTRSRSRCVSRRCAGCRSRSVGCRSAASRRHLGGMGPARARGRWHAARRRANSSRACTSADLHRGGKHFKDFDKPVLMAWGTEKDFFPVEDAERLARDFPKRGSRRSTTATRTCRRTSLSDSRN